MLKVIILFVCIATILADYSANGPLAWWDTVRHIHRIRILVFFFMMFFSRMILKIIKIKQVTVSHFHNVWYLVPNQAISNRHHCKNYLIKKFKKKKEIYNMNVMKIANMAIVI